MSEFQVKDIHLLTATTAVNAQQKIATDVPTGVGNAHNQRSITKAAFLVYDGNAIPTRQDGGTGAFRVLNMKGTDMWLEVIGAATAAILRGGSILGISPDGSTIPARFESDGKVVGTMLQLTNGANTYDITFTASSNQNATVVESGVIQINPKTTVSEPLTGGTVTVPNTQHAVMYIKPAGTLGSLTINMPNAATEGRRVSFYFSQDITAITHNGTSGATILSPLTTATAGDRVTYIFQTTENVWIPIS